MDKFYAIHFPLEHRGVYLEWKIVKPLVHGRPYADFKSFGTKKEAEEFSVKGSGRFTQDKKGSIQKQNQK